MRVLDLFSGTQSLRRHIGLEHHVTCVDNRPRSRPDICADIGTWDYTVLKPGQFDVVWTSPPCTEYSKAKTIGVRDIQGSNILVQRTLEIIKYLSPKVWFMENPESGLLKRQPFMDGLPFYDVSYCKYGFLYRKQTRLWTNLEGFEAKTCRWDCDALETNPVTGQLWHKVNFGAPTARGHAVSLRERYSVPPALVDDLFRCVALHIERGLI